MTRRHFVACSFSSLSVSACIRLVSPIILAASMLSASACTTTTAQNGGLGVDAKNHSNNTKTSNPQKNPDAKKVTLQGTTLIYTPTPDGVDQLAYVDGTTGQQLTYADVMARIQAHDVILVGEQHDQMLHHRIERRVVEIAVATGSSVAVGLEMLPWPYQSELDRYNSGVIDEEQLAKATEWSKTWGFGFEMYQPIFAAGRVGKARFVAINAPRSLVKAVSKQGIDGVSPEERAQLPEMDLTDEVHRAEIREVFEAHHPPVGAADAADKAFDRFYSAQVLWDESMADGAVKARKNGAARVVVLAGVGHVGGGRGIAQRVVRRMPEAKVLKIVPMPIGTSEDENISMINEALASDMAEILVVAKPKEVIEL